MNTRILAAAAVALFLTACGGGGGGSTTPSAMMSGETEPQVTAADVQDAASTISVAGQVGSSLPAFGSVTQSANRDGVSGVSTDRASTEFDGETFVLKVDRQSGTDLHLSTAEDGTFLNPVTTSSLAGHDASQDGYIVDYTQSETTLAYGVVSWDSADPSDYLVYRL